MKRKSSKALLIAIIAVMFILVFALVGCGSEKKKKTTEYKASDALKEVLTAADATLGDLGNGSGAKSLGLSIGVKGENLKLKINESDVNVNIGVDQPVNFNAKVKVGANFDKTTATNNEIKAEVEVGGNVKFGLYSKDNTVYVNDGVTSATAKKIKVSGAQAVGYGQYLDDIPEILDKFIFGVPNDKNNPGIKSTISGLGSQLENLAPTINGLIKAEKKTDGYSFEIVFIDSKDKTKGLGPIIKTLGNQLKFGETIDNLIATYLPYILGGNFQDFVAGTVKKTSKISLDLGVKDNKLTGLAIVIDLDPLKESTEQKIKDGVGGKITIEIGDLVLKSGKENILPNDLASYQEGAVTANLALNIPNNEGLTFSAKLEFSPNLTDKDMKLKVVANNKNGTAVDLKAAYINYGTDQNPDYAIVFDIGYLYEVAGLEKPANTKYKYSMNLGKFLTDLITSQRVFVFYDSADANLWWEYRARSDFFKANGESFTATDLDDITSDIKAYYAGKYGGAAEDYKVAYRFGDGEIALQNGAGKFIGRTAELGYNLELTAIVSLADEATYQGTYSREVHKVTFQKDVNGTDKKECLVVTKEAPEPGTNVPPIDVSGFAPAWTPAKDTYFVGWEMRAGSSTEVEKTFGGDKIYLDGDLDSDVTLTYKTESTASKIKLVFKKYDFETGGLVDYYTNYYVSSKDPVKSKDQVLIPVGSLPQVPEIMGMTGKWMIINAQGSGGLGTREISNQVLEANGNNYAIKVDNNTSTVYPVYERIAGFDWSVREESDRSKVLEARFVREKQNEGKLTSFLEEGDASLIGQGAVNAILGSLGDIFKIIGSKSVDAKFIAKIAGAISPYLGNEKLLAARIRNIIKNPLTDEELAEMKVYYPFLLPVLKNGDATVSEDSVKNIDDLVKVTEGSTELVTKMTDNSQNAVIYATYMRFVGLYGNLTVTANDAGKAPYFWTETQISNYNSATTATAKAAVYVTNEKASYNAKVTGREAQIATKVQESEEYVLNFIKGYLGANAVTGITTVEQFLFGADGNSPLKIAFDFAAPEGNKGLGVTVKVMRGETLLAEIKGDVFLSFASAIDLTQGGLTATDFADAVSVLDLMDDDLNPGTVISKVVYELKKISMAMGEQSAA